MAKKNKKQKQLVKFAKTSFCECLLDLIRPKYYGMCDACNEVHLLSRSKPCKHNLWQCNKCESILIIKRLKKYKTINDIKLQIVNDVKKESNSLKIFK